MLGTEVKDMDYIDRLTASGVSEEDAGAIVERYLTAGDVDGLESYVVFCEAAATIL